MSRDSLVTAEAVFTAADQLIEAGKNPSLRAVRKELGGGSFGSILPFLQSWRRARGREPDEETSSDLSTLPPSIAAAIDRLNQAVHDISEAIQHEDARRREAETGPSQAELREEVETLQRMALEQIGKLRDERDALSRDLVEAQRELRQLRDWRKNAMEHMRALSVKSGDGS